MAAILSSLLFFTSATKHWVYSSIPTSKTLLQETRALYQQLHHCTENRTLAFQTLLEGCCDVLTHHTRMAELIQPSPVCSRRARLMTETRKAMRKKKCENTDLQKRKRERQETHG